MKDAVKKGLFILMILLGAMGFLTGQKFVGGALLIIGIMLMYTNKADSKRKGEYSKALTSDTDMTLRDICDRLGDMNTALGKGWIGRNRNVEGECLYWGPNSFKDYIYVLKEKNEFFIKYSSDISDIKPYESDEWRLEHIIDSSKVDVTVARYSESASERVSVMVMMEDLHEIINNLIKNDTAPENKSLDIAKMYYYCEPDYTLRDIEGNEYCVSKSKVSPLNIQIMDTADNKVLSITQDPVSGYNVEWNGEKYGVLYREENSSNDEYVMKTKDGTFSIKNFKAVKRANMSCNYRVSLDSLDVAVLAVPKPMRYEGTDNSPIDNNIINVYDDKYLPFYMAVEMLILTINKFIR